MGSDSAQVDVSTSGGVAQVHALAGSSAAQANTSNDGAVQQAFPHVLQAQSTVAPNTSSAAAILQTHLLSGAHAAQGVIASGGIVAQAQSLRGNDAVTKTTCMGGKIGIDYRFKTLGAELRHTCPGSKLHGLNFGRSLTAPVLCSRLSSPSAAHTVKPVNCSTTLTTSDKKTLLTRYNP